MARRAWDAVEEHGMLIEGRSGKKKNPASSWYESFAREYRQYQKMIDDVIRRGSYDPDDEFDPIDF